MFGGLGFRARVKEGLNSLLSQVVGHTCECDSSARHYRARNPKSLNPAPQNPKPQPLNP